jgi:hypothetical protein
MGLLSGNTLTGCLRNRVQATSGFFILPYLQPTNRLMTYPPQGEDAMRLNKYALAGSLFLSLSVSAHGGDFSGSQLLSICDKSGGARDERVATGCTAWIIGFTSGLFVAQTASKNGDDGVCIPDGVTAGQARETIQKFMQDHPSTQHEMAAVISFAALKQAFPCSKDDLRNGGRQPK